LLNNAYNFKNNHRYILDNNIRLFLNFSTYVSLGNALHLELLAIHIDLYHVFFFIGQTHTPLYYTTLKYILNSTPLGIESLSFSLKSFSLYHLSYKLLTIFIMLGHWTIEELYVNLTIKTLLILLHKILMLSAIGREILSSRLDVCLIGIRNSLSFIFRGTSMKL
jgi:hypothetical protein